MKPLRIAVLLSGGGRTLENFHHRIQAGTLNCEIVAVASSSTKAGGVDKARRFGYPVFASDEKDHGKLSDAINEFILQHEPDLVVLAGFLKLYTIPKGYETKVVNIHPALVPSFCGPGFYGMRVHKAVVDAGVKLTGCTVHFVSPVYDDGPILAQRCVPVLSGDTPEDVAHRVFELECEVYPEALNLIAAGRVKLIDKKVMIEGEAEWI